jgi:hypothetical protein
MPTQTPFGPCAPVPCDLTWYGETTSAKIDSALSDQALRLFSSGALGSDRSGGISANSTPLSGLIQQPMNAGSAQHGV